MAQEKERMKMGMLDQFKKLVPQGENSEYGILLSANFENEVMLASAHLEDLCFEKESDFQIKCNVIRHKRYQNINLEDLAALIKNYLEENNKK